MSRGKLNHRHRLNYLLSHSSLAITLTTLNFGQECFRLGIIAPRALDLVLNKATINPSSQDSVGQANQPFSAKIPGKSSIPQQNLSRYSFFIFPLFFIILQYFMAKIFISFPSAQICKNYLFFIYGIKKTFGCLNLHQGRDV